MGHSNRWYNLFLVTKILGSNPSPTPLSLTQTDRQQIKIMQNPFFITKVLQNLIVKIMFVASRQLFLDVAVLKFRRLYAAMNGQVRYMSYTFPDLQI